MAKTAKAAVAKKTRRKPKLTRLKNFYRIMREQKAKEDAITKAAVDRLIEIGDRQGWGFVETLQHAVAALEEKLRPVSIDEALPKRKE
jgi:hypothetical protein